MTDDIVARLRADLRWFGKVPKHNMVQIDAEKVPRFVEKLKVAADEIERLRQLFRAYMRGPDDLVGRLRILECDLLKEDDLDDVYYLRVIGEAADEIERLRETISRLEGQR